MKTEKEKAAEGLLYNANHDSELQDEMKERNASFSNTTNCPPTKRGRKDRILTSFLGKKGRTPLSYPLSNAIMAIISRLGIISSPT